MFDPQDPEPLQHPLLDRRTYRANLLGLNVKLDVSGNSKMIRILDILFEPPSITGDTSPPISHTHQADDLTPRDLRT